MSSLVSLFYCMTSMYFSYSSISYKLVLANMSDLFMCSSFIHHLKALVLDEKDLSIHLMNDLLMSSVFVISERLAFFMKFEFKLRTL
jgi:hypothetical protein